MLHRGPRQKQRGARGVVCASEVKKSGKVETGMSLMEFGQQARVNPLDVVERMAATNDWSFERAGEDEITILVRGKWTDYQVSYTWMFDIEALHLACAFELKVPERRRGEVQQLISMINEPPGLSTSCACGMSLSITSVPVGPANTASRGSNLRTSSCT